MPSAAAVTRTPPPRAMTAGSTLRFSTLVTSAVRSVTGPPSAWLLVPAGPGRAAAPGIKRRFEVGDQVPGSLDTDGEAEQVVRHGRGRSLTAAPVLDQAFHPAQRRGPLEHPDLAQHGAGRPAPPATRTDSMPPNPPSICWAAI